MEDEQREGDLLVCFLKFLKEGKTSNRRGGDRRLGLFDFININFISIIN